MKNIFIIAFLFLVAAGNAFAHELSITKVDKPYEIVPIEGDIRNELIFLGDLSGFPFMYEFSIDEPLLLTAQLRQRYWSSVEPINFSLIMVRQNDDGGGVKEVARLRPESDEWVTLRDSRIGMTFRDSETMSAEVGPGIYRIEVSTPENLGHYMLILGNDDETIGYFESLKEARIIQSFFGFVPLKMLSSSLVYYPLGIIMILFMFNRTLKYRKKITHAD